MSDLAAQLLKRVPAQGTVDRADLAVAANYDSVGRVLRQLVEDGKIVRVGRGRYRRSTRKSEMSTRTITESIEQRLIRSKRNVFLRADFSTLGSYDAVGRALRQLVERGRLLQIGHGLYAKAERSPFTGKPTPLIGIRRLATEALGRLGKAVSSSSFEISYNSGRSTQVPTGRSLSVKNRMRRRIGYDGNYVVFERA